MLVYYHPNITDTLLSPTSLAQSATEPKGSYSGEAIYRWFADETMLTGNMTLIVHHRRSKARNIIVHGRLFGGQLYTHPLILPDVNPNHVNATTHNSFELARTKDSQFIGACKHALDIEIAAVSYQKHKELV